jgi:hypothetical protein
LRTMNRVGFGKKPQQRQIQHTAHGERHRHTEIAAAR